MHTVIATAKYRRIRRDTKVVPSLLVGLLVAMFQAATQINEQTLSFLPRLLVMLVTLIVAGPWLVQKFMEYITTLYTSIPQLIG